jgi:hypothetical protein
MMFSSKKKEDEIGQRLLSMREKRVFFIYQMRVFSD